MRQLSLLPTYKIYGNFENPLSCIYPIEECPSVLLEKKGLLRTEEYILDAAMKTLEYILDGTSGSESLEVILDGTCSWEAATGAAVKTLEYILDGGSGSEAAL